MGYLNALGMAESGVDLDVALTWHLRSNHYPPVPVEMVGPCKRAIQYAKRGDWDHRVRLPKGTTWRGERTAPVHAVVEGHHLEAFLG